MTEKNGNHHKKEDGLDLGYRRFVSPNCDKCKHVLNLGIEHSCAAFPGKDTIPEVIWNGDIDHNQPYQGDHDIQFEARQIKEHKP